MTLDEHYYAHGCTKRCALHCTQEVEFRGNLYYLAWDFEILALRLKNPHNKKVLLEDLFSAAIVILKIPLGGILFEEAELSDFQLQMSPIAKTVWTDNLISY